MSRKVVELIAAASLLLAATSCVKLKDVEVINPCDEEVTVNLWEAERPVQDGSDTPEVLTVPPLSRAVAQDALADAGKNGSSAEIVSGPGKGHVIFIPHAKRLSVIIPGRLC